jgi:tetratricopeptide (TPR) repeat protein
MFYFKFKLIFISFAFMSWPLLASQISINSQPEGAEVIAQMARGGKKIKIGTTPLKIDHSRIEALTQGVAYKIEVMKSGFEVYRLLVASTGKEDIELQATLEPSQEMKLGPSIDVLVFNLFEVQRLIRSKDYDGALIKLSELEKSHANLSSVWEIKGSINYIKKNFNIALSDYRKAFTLNPQNEVAQRMKEYLESKNPTKEDQ